MGRAVWRVTEKPKIAIFGPGPGPVRPHGEAGLDGSGDGWGGLGEDPSMDGTALPQRHLPKEESFVCIQLNVSQFDLH